MRSRRYGLLSFALAVFLESQGFFSISKDGFGLAPIRILLSQLQTSDMPSADVLYPSQSPAKKQRLEGTPQHQSSSEDPRSKIEYYTYDEEVEDDSDGMHEMTDKEHEEYERQIKESDGFDVMHFPRSFGFGKIVPLFSFALDEVVEDLKSYSQLALKQYNKIENRNLELVKVVKANRQGVAGFLYFITFDVKDPDDIDGRTMEFQAKVWDGISETTIELCRPKPSRGKQPTLFDGIDQYALKCL
ncbi:hypothetical protein RHMOL_Rhmol09G0121600 [Rhododendron molle]|uniref:Uncharacterized protein n=1 Tax=Rhododendron molle TaxID=49168 RepID=A0ACC0MCG7_RHOML|nr:hypothetical protein RHMOL_Rhmol09G0121600 [Rhododendron molle]